MILFGDVTEDDTLQVLMLTADELVNEEKEDADGFSLMVGKIKIQKGLNVNG